MGKLNIHEIWDRVGATVGGFVYRKTPFFGESLEALPLRDVVGKTSAEVEDIKPGNWKTVKARGPAGVFSCSYLVYRWIWSELPTLIYIHGSGESPANFGRFSDNSFNKIFTRDFPLDINLVLIRAPFHEGSQAEYIKALGKLNNYVGMLASSVAVLDSLARHFREEGCSEVLGAGFSLGGWVLNLHRAFIGEGIDRYIPICAGTRPEEVFISSHYRKLVGEKARENPEVLKNVLNFEKEFKSNPKQDCFPLLFQYDLLTEMKTQAPAFAGMDLKVLKKGHFAGQQAINEMREHIIFSINR